MRAYLVIFAAALSGCGPSSFSEFQKMLVDRWCARAVRCGLVGASEQAKCGVPPVLALVTPGSIDVATSISYNRMRFHPDNAKECLKAVEDAPCDQSQAADELARHCHGVVGPKVATGGDCSGDEECVGGMCVGAPCAGSCVAYAFPGAACVPSGGAPSQTCDPTVHYCDGVCKHKKPGGESCAADDECLYDNVCVDGKCGTPARIAADDVCGTRTPPCENGLYCAETGSCQPRVALGGACTRANACKDGLTCIAGACSGWLDVGSACAPSATLPSGCPDSQTCTAGKCAATGLGVGPLQRCTVDGDCGEGLWCDRGYCQYRGGVTAVCTDARACLDGLVCDLTCKTPAGALCPAPPPLR